MNDNKTCRVCGKPDQEGVFCGSCESAYGGLFDLDSPDERYKAKKHHHEQLRGMTSSSSAPGWEAPNWLKNNTFPIVVIIALIHIFHFDHWGRTFERAMQFFASYMTMDVLNAVLHVGWILISCLLVIAAFIGSQVAAINTHKRFYWLCMGLVVLSEFWCFMNPDMLPNEIVSVFSKGEFHPLGAIPTALFLGAFSGLLYKLLKIMDTDGSCGELFYLYSLVSVFAIAYMPNVVSGNYDNAEPSIGPAFSSIFFMGLCILPIVIQCSIIIKRLTKYLKESRLKEGLRASAES